MTPRCSRADPFAKDSISYLPHDLLDFLNVQEAVMLMALLG